MQSSIYLKQLKYTIRENTQLTYEGKYKNKNTENDKRDAEKQ